MTVKREIRVEPRRTHKASVKVLPVSWYTIREAAKELGLSYEAARERVRDGTFKRIQKTPTPSGGRETVLIASCCVRAEKEGALCECAADAA